MRTLPLPWETRRTFIAIPGEKGPPSILGHASHLETHVEQHPPSQATVILPLTDDLLLR